MIESIKTKLGELVPEGALKMVGGAPEFQASAERNPTATPACYVFLLGEAASPSELAGATLQSVRASVSVTLCVKNLSDSKGVAAMADLELLRKQVRNKIYGWEPVEGYDPMERGDSALLAFRDGHVWWQDIYLTSYFDRSEQ